MRVKLKNSQFSLNAGTVVPLLRDLPLVLGNGGLKREVAFHQGDNAKL